MPLDQKNCSSEECARWEARFAPPDYAFGKEPNYFLKSCQKLLPRSGRVLAVADGEGRNGVWLAQQGLKVVSLDFSPTAQKKARTLAAERRVEPTFVQADVHADQQTWPGNPLVGGDRPHRQATLNTSR